MATLYQVMSKYGERGLVRASKREAITLAKATGPGAYVEALTVSIDKETVRRLIEDGSGYCQHAETIYTVPEEN